MRLFFFFLFFLSAVFAKEDPFELIPSTVNEIASFYTDESILIGNLISPLSGQLSLRTTDLEVLGAQILSLKRVYVPPSISLAPLIPENYAQFMQFRDFHLTMQGEYRGWVFAPQSYLIRETLNRTLLSDVSGAILVFENHSDGTNAKLVSTFGVSNFCHGTPQAQNDIRNIQFSFENDQRVVFPDGTIRIYRPLCGISVLEKEILPNSKVIRYFFEGLELKRIESKDPTEQHTYGSITVEGEKKEIGLKEMASCRNRCIPI